jgi:hypothetical protein
MAVLERLQASAEAGSEQAKIEEMRRLANANQFTRTKTLRAGNDALAVLAIMPDIIDLSVPDTEDGEPVGISVIGGKGTLIKGPVGFTASPSQIRIAGLWTLNDTILSGYPSTIMTPIPVAKFNIPFESISEFATSTALAILFFGALG